MAIRHALIILSVSLAAALAVPACSSTTKYRVLSFFFDEVPPPGGMTGPEGSSPDTETGSSQETAPGRRIAVRAMVYSHEPYRDGRCGSCHDARTGRIYRTPQEGLCGTCHGDVPGDARYVHGPVAVGDCFFCHHPHTSAHPKLLLADATGTCYRCHDRADLIPGAHHAGLEQQTCVECHDPHGGGNPFFLKRSEP